MNSDSVTWTILHRNSNFCQSIPVTTGIVDAHDYDHAEELFEQQNSGEIILGIYEGDLSRKKAINIYHNENL
jgi:hypothetical protein